MEGEEDEQLKQWERGNKCFDVENEAINVVAGGNHDLLESDAELGYEEMVGEFDAGRREILVVDNVLFQAWWCSGETSNGAANGMADVLSWMSNMGFYRKLVISFN
ncbi:hypothetical protein GOBAR_DD06918 [Gossypium barbadense]|nr:hypothetical protein GOBAR_DD06918 [Gossypium barbadense]